LRLTRSFGYIDEIIASYSSIVLETSYLKMKVNINVSISLKTRYYYIQLSVFL